MVIFLDWNMMLCFWFFNLFHSPNKANLSATILKVAVEFSLKQVLAMSKYQLSWIPHLLVVDSISSQSSTSKVLTWIQCKLGKQYLVKKVTLPWESNPGPTPIRGGTATLIALKQMNSWWKAENLSSHFIGDFWWTLTTGKEYSSALAKVSTNFQNSSTNSSWRWRLRWCIM